MDCCSSCDDSECDLYYCRDCERNESSNVKTKGLLCETCVSVHVKKCHEIKFLSDHIPVICKTHRRLHINYCKTCDVTFCPLCLHEHSRHEMGIAQNRAKEAKKDVSEFLNQLEMQEKPLRRTKQCLAEMEEKHKKYREELRKILEEKWEEIKQNLFKSIDISIANIEQEGETLTSLIENTFKLQQDSRNILGLPHCSMITEHRSLKKKVEDFKKQCEKLENKNMSEQLRETENFGELEDNFKKLKEKATSILELFAGVEFSGSQNRTSPENGHLENEHTNIKCHKLASEEPYGTETTSFSKADIKEGQKTEECDVGGVKIENEKRKKDNSELETWSAEIGRSEVALSSKADEKIDQKVKDELTDKMLEEEREKQKFFRYPYEIEKKEKDTSETKTWISEMCRSETASPFKTEEKSDHKVKDELADKELEVEREKQKFFRYPYEVEKKEKDTSETKTWSSEMCRSETASPFKTEEKSDHKVKDELADKELEEEREKQKFFRYPYEVEKKEKDTSETKTWSSEMCRSETASPFKTEEKSDHKVKDELADKELEVEREKQKFFRYPYEVEKKEKDTSETKTWSSEMCRSETASPFKTEEKSDHKVKDELADKELEEEREKQMFFRYPNEVEKKE
ncbi:uncharacterized protein LOC142351071 isoform X2 [Convolutriloba macropyga]|uniref:uncharacterized protein LOC142351071 isoform X2 n=1 Tax=Convolutriloba macropyga TaxID=536237 RepID=UPI003F51C863